MSELICPTCFVRLDPKALPCGHTPPSRRCSRCGRCACHLPSRDRLPYLEGTGRSRSPLERQWREDQPDRFNLRGPNELPVPLQKVAIEEGLQLYFLGMEGGRAYFWTDEFRPGLRRRILTALIASGLDVETVHLREVAVEHEPPRLERPYRRIAGEYGYLDSGLRKRLLPKDFRWLSRLDVPRDGTEIRVSHCVEIAPIPKHEHNWVLKVHVIEDDLSYLRQLYADYCLVLVYSDRDIPSGHEGLTAVFDAARAIGFDRVMKGLLSPFRGYIACVMHVKAGEQGFRIDSIHVCHPHTPVNGGPVWALQYRWRRRCCEARYCTGFHRIMIPHRGKTAGSPMSDRVHTGRSIS